MQTLLEQDVKSLIKILKKYFINVYKLIYFLDQKQADIFKQKNTYYYQQDQEKHQHKKHDHDHNNQTGCCGSFFAKIYIPEKEMNGLETVVAEVLRDIKDWIPELLDYLQLKFNRIKSSGEKDNLTWNAETEVYVMNEVMREGVLLFMKDKVRKLMQRAQYIDSKQPMLLATPQTWTTKHPKIPLEFLSNDFIESLMRKGHGQQMSFIKNVDFTRKFFNECVFLEKDGRFEESLQEQHVREDKILWVNLSEIEKDSFKNIYFIAHILSALPYELNSKTQILAQISETYQISYFDSKRTIHKKHLDSSYSTTNDTGKKVSIMYFAVDPDDEFTDSSHCVTILDGDEEIKYQIKTDMIIGVMSRKIPYQIETNGRRIVIIRFWIDGPQDSRTNY